MQRTLAEETAGPVSFYTTLRMFLSRDWYYPGVEEDEPRDERIHEPARGARCRYRRLRSGPRGGTGCRAEVGGVADTGNVAGKTWNTLRRATCSPQIRIFTSCIYGRGTSSLYRSSADPMIWNYNFGTRWNATSTARFLLKTWGDLFEGTGSLS